MSAYALRRPLRGTARSRMLEVAAAVALAAIAAGATWYLDEHGSFRGLAFAAFVVALLWLATTRRTQLALVLFMIYVGALDGFFKLTTGADVVTLARDALLFAIVVGVLVRAQVTGARLNAPPLTAWVAGFVVLVLVQLLNPQAGTVAHSLAGVRQHLEFVPLFFLTFAFVRTTKALRTFVVVLLLIAAANGVVSWVQFRLEPEQLAKWGTGYAERVLGEGRFVESGRTFASAGGEDRIRPFGLGSDAGSGGVIGAFALGGVLALASLFTRVRYLLFAVAMAIGATTAIITSQVRGVVVAGVIVVLAYGLLTAMSRGRVASLLGIAVGVLVSFFVIQGIVGAVGADALRYEGLSTSRILKTTGEARGESLAAIPDNMADYPLGAGLGTAGPASGVAGGSELVGEVDAESWFSFMTIETGIAGTALMTLFTCLLFGLGLVRCRHEPDREARMLLAAIIAPLAAILVLYTIGGGLTATTPGGPYLWAVAGIVSYWLVARPAALRREGLAVPDR
jgi:hypothetical protein